jgi:hypothetical protein
MVSPCDMVEKEETVTLTFAMRGNRRVCACSRACLLRVLSLGVSYRSGARGPALVVGAEDLVQVLERQRIVGGEPVRVYVPHTSARDKC